MKKIYFLFMSTLFLNVAFAQIGTVESFSKISATEGNFTGTLLTGDSFANAEVIGDLDNDGFEDIAIGAREDDDGGTDRGAVWILFLNEDRTVKSYQKISDTEGNFPGTLDNGDMFGSSVTAIGDIDGDGVIDIGVGAWSDDDDYPNSGAEWILFMNTDGTVKFHQKISATEGGLVGLTANRLFGINACALGDLDGDQIPDIVVGTPNYDNDGGLYRGCIWVLFLNSNGSVKAQQKINDVHGNFNVILEDGDRFGDGLSNLGDINGDGIIDIAVAAKYDDDGADEAGAVYILFLDTDGTVKSHQKISATEGGFTGVLDSNDQFGYNTTELDDIDNDGVNDIAVGAMCDDDGGENRGAVWILMLNNDGTVKAHQKISSTEGSFDGTLDNEDHFGKYLTHFKTGEKELLVGAPNDDDGGENVGAVWILDLNANYVSSVKYKTNKFENINIYPNPSSDFIYISFEDIKTENAKLQIFDLTGKMLKEGVLKEKIDVSNLKKGIYILRIQSEKQVKIGKFEKK